MHILDECITALKVMYLLKVIFVELLLANGDSLLPGYLMILIADPVSMFFYSQTNPRVSLTCQGSIEPDRCLDWSAPCSEGPRFSAFAYPRPTVSEG